MHTKAGFSQVPVPGYLPSSHDLEQTDADQIIQMANEEVTSTNKEMQVIMQSYNKHPHINKSGSFSRLRSFKLNNMGFRLNKISLITFNVENPQTPADCGIKGRAPTSIPRERRVPWINQQQQTHDGVANLNEAHHEPRGNASYNPDKSITNKHVQGRFVPPKVGNMSTQPQQQQLSSSEEGSKENTILSGLRHQKERSAQDHTSGPADGMPQGPAPAAPTSQTGGLPWAPPVNNQNRDHQDLLECNGTTRTPADGKGPGAAKGRNKASEPHPATSSGTGPARQPAESSKNTSVCSACGESGHWSRNCPYYNFCDFFRVTTHSTHMCRAAKHGPRSPVCIYCGKTNHSLAYCRYRPRDNQEEPRNTPDELVTLAKIWHRWPEIKPEPPLKIIIKFLSPIQMVEVKINPVEVNIDLSRESKLVLPPEVNSQILILIFLPGESNTLILMKVSTGDILPPHFLPLDLITQWPVMLLVDPSSS